MSARRAAAAPTPVPCLLCGRPAQATLALRIGHVLCSRAALCEAHIGAVRCGRWGVNVEWQRANWEKGHDE